MGCLQASFANASEVVDGSLCLIVGHLRSDESTKPEISPARSASHKEQHSQKSAAPNSAGSLWRHIIWSSTPASPDAMVLCFYTERCQLSVIQVLI